MEGGYELPVYVKVFGAIACVLCLFIISAYPKLWDWTQALLRKIDIRQQARASVLSISKISLMLKHSQEIYLTRPRAL